MVVARCCQEERRRCVSWRDDRATCGKRRRFESANTSNDRSEQRERRDSRLNPIRTHRFPLSFFLSSPFYGLLAFTRYLALGFLEFSSGLFSPSSPSRAASFLGLGGVLDRFQPSFLFTVYTGFDRFDYEPDFVERRKCSSTMRR